MFSMAVGTIGKGLKRVPFFVKRRTVDSGGGGGWVVLRGILDEYVVL